MKTTAVVLLTVSTIGIIAAPAVPPPVVLTEPNISTHTTRVTKTLASGVITLKPSHAKRDLPPLDQNPFQPHQTDAPGTQPEPPGQSQGPPGDPGPSSSDPSPTPAPSTEPPGDRGPSPSAPSSSLPVQTSSPPPAQSSSLPSNGPTRPDQSSAPSRPSSTSSPLHPSSIPAPDDPTERLLITSFVSNSCPFPVYLTSATCCPPGQNCSTPTAELFPNENSFNITHATNDSCGQTIKISPTGDWNSPVYQIEYTVDGDLVWYNLSAIDGDPFWEVKRFLEVRGKGCESMLCPAGEERSTCNWPMLGDCPAKNGNDVSFYLC